MNEEQIKFIDKLYKDLYLNESLKKHTTSKDKYKSIKEYIEFLESIHNKVINHNHIDTLKKMYHEKYIIKEENIPDSYYKHQEEMYLERGFGHIELPEEEKKELNEIIINDQKKSLDKWLDYFLSSDSNYIPYWAKYWAFQGMLKLGNFDKETGKYTKRTKHTVSKFADLNREALALSIDALLKYLDKKEINDKELEQLVKTGSFQSIYTYITNKILSNNTNIIKRNEGKWIKYDQGSDHMPLVNSLQGYNTGWCTAGESTAHQQLSNGDFYVYCTLDENDEYKIPRIAIRMEGNSIGEIRGIASGQNLEPEMEEIVKEKIKDFPDKEKYYKKANDMETLTRIYKKHNSNEELTKEELTFLYEIDAKIEGFGYRKDPRIEEILNYREPKNDIAYIFDIDKSQVALTKEEITKNTKCFFGDLEYLKYNNDFNSEIFLPEIVIGNFRLTSSKNIYKYRLPKKIYGFLIFYLSKYDAYDIEFLEKITMPEYVSGDLSIHGVGVLENVTFPEKIGGYIALYDTCVLENVKFPQEVFSDLVLDKLEYCKNVEMPKKMNGFLGLHDLSKFENFNFPLEVNGMDLSSIRTLENMKLPEIKNNGLVRFNALESAKGLKIPSNFKGSFIFGKLQNVDDLVIPEDFKGDLELKSLEDAQNLILPKEMRSLSLPNLKSAKGLKLPKKIGSLILKSLTTADDLILPEEIDGTLNLEELRSAHNLKLPEKINSLKLNSLIDAKELVLPKKMKGFLELCNLTHVEELTLPEEVESVNLSKLKEANIIILPKVSNGVYLYELNDISCLKIPDPLTYPIHFKYYKITPENVHKYTSNKIIS